jgi:predicted transcriptional regulator
MPGLRRLGDLELAVLEHLWDSDRPQTVRQVHDGLRTQRRLAYTTVMTVLQRLSAKDLVLQIRDDRAYQYAPAQSQDELIADLMVDVLDQFTDRGVRHSTLMIFLERVGVDEVEALRHALAEVGERLSPARPRIA